MDRLLIEVTEADEAVIGLDREAAISRAWFNYRAKLEAWRRGEETMGVVDMYERAYRDLL